MNACGICHVLVDELMDAERCIEQTETKRLRDPVVNRSARRLEVQRHLAAKEKIWVEVAESEVGVCDGRFFAASAVAGRPRIGRRAFGPDLQKSHGVDTRD